ncbi:MAG: IPT/TIG domain-containing protein [Actinobacteria bacterium]|nr:IPT/TIG domain-containing protein [Actinomycetota bacterium]MBU1944604.1 IPT/TIG domain-containing protein [Actinomycetota bacterium]MBU2689157.1 IPT/TIG domain-containing protein [Actinomycetota bacterium]
MRRGRVTVPAAAICVLAMVVALSAGCGGANKPVVSSTTPASSDPGLEVAILGQDFGSEQGDSTVSFGDQKTAVQDWTDTAITAMVPRDLKAGDYKVTVTTSGGTSDPLDFEVLKTGTSHAVNPGEIEHTVPVQAIEAWLKKSGVDATGMTFSVYSASKNDPNWKIDNAYQGGSLWGQFLLRNVKGNWTVVEAKQAITSDDLKKYGAPSDLLPSPPTPPTPPQPPKEAAAITAYLQSKGQLIDGWTFRVAKVSTQDPNWEIVTGTREATSDNFLVVFNNMLGDWQCLADQGPPWPGVEFKGEAVPSDLNSLP